MMLTPGLTPHQASTLREALFRLTRSHEAPTVYADADRIAGRWWMSPHAADHETASQTIDTLTRDHPQHPPTLIAYIAGLAFGVRTGKRFGPVGHRSKQWISDDYRKLPENDRRTVGRFIRSLLRARERPNVTRRSDPQADVASCQKWARIAGQTRRGR